MPDFKTMNHHLQMFTDNHFARCCKEHHIDINPKELKIILKLIQNNPYAIMNEEYFPVVLLKIEKETNIDTLERIKPIIVEKYLLELLM